MPQHREWLCGTLVSEQRSQTQRSSSGSESDKHGGALAELFSSSTLLKQLAVLEEVRPHLEAEDIEVPGIVVAGAQSAGKSSVLEALAGVNLPRGENITTRVPLQLSLVTDSTAEPHALIGTREDFEGCQPISLDDIGDRVRALTEKLAGKGGAVVDKPIHLCVVRTQCPPMTLTDLPGITHISQNESATGGDSHGDIHATTVALVKKYINNPAIIILVVVPATDDFANAEAIKLAKDVDPEGKRTLGVVTKTDMVGAGSKILRKLYMEDGHVRLDMGFIAIINRNPVEVENNIGHSEIRQREKQFFTTHPELPEAAETFVVELRRYVERVLRHLLDESLGNEYPLLGQHLHALLTIFLDERQACARRAVNDLCQAERDRPFTLNHYYADTMEKVKNEMARSQQVDACDIQAVGGVSSEFIALAKDSGNDDRGILEMQVSLFAYSKVARKRVSDVVPTLAHAHLIDALYSGGSVDGQLLHQLDSMSASLVEDSARLPQVMGIDPALARERERCELSAKRFTKALEILERPLGKVS